MPQPLQIKFPNRQLLILLAVAGVLFLVWNELQRGGQYRLGMTINEVRSTMKNRYPVIQYGCVYNAAPTTEEFNKDLIYYIYDEDTGWLLSFNQHEVLLKKQRLKFFGIKVYDLIDRLR